MPSRIAPAGFAAALFVVVALPAPAMAGQGQGQATCSGSNAWGYCNDGSSLVVSGSQTTPGSGGNSDSGGNRSGTGTTPVIYVPPPPPTFSECLRNWDSMMTCFEAQSDDDPEADESDSTALPPITITDLASFAPDGATLAGEPDNLGVAGLPTNFVTGASTHTQAGTLFGYPVQVRFTPDTYTFHYGDGESRASDSAGTTWADLGQAQFTPTSTSHTYAERGTYDARVDIAYTAEIDLGVGWFPLSGHLTTDGTPQTIRIYEAHTALVARTCAEQPTAPGC